MSIKAGKKLGFFAALSMMLGSVVGIGIFLKNDSVLASNDWSGISTLMAWIIGGILALATAISYSEISTLKPKKVTGLPAYAEEAGGKKFGYFVKFNFSVFYYGLYAVTLSIFVGETLIGIFTALLNKPMPHFGVVALVGLSLLAFVFACDYISIKIFGYVQISTVVLKFIPLILVTLIGLILATTNLHPDTGASGQEYGQSAFTNGRKFDPTKMLASLPAVLFAYDQFLNASTIRNRMKNPDKLPLIFSLGMIMVIVLYSLIALAAILHGSGLISGKILGASPEDGLGIFDQALPLAAANVMGIIVIIFLFISTYGVVNGSVMCLINSTILASDTDTFFGSRKLRSKYKSHSPLVYMLGIMIFYILIVVLPAIIMNNDAMVDSWSNFTALLMFPIYAGVVLLYKIRREKMATKKIKKWIFNISALVSIIGIGFVFAYQVGYGMSLQLISDPNKIVNGLFVKGATGGYAEFTNLALFINFFVAIILFLVLPSINALLIRKFEKRDPFADEEITLTAEEETVKKVKSKKPAVVATK